MFWVKWIASLAFISYIVFGLLLYFLQDNFLYYPTLPLESHDLSVLDFRSEQDVIIKILVLNKGQKQAIFYFGGNAEKVGHDADDLQQVLPNKTVYFINYRGYGGSAGIPNEANIFADVLKIYDHLKQQHTEVSVIGRSLGTGVAVYLAAEREVSQLVLVTPYDSIKNVAQIHYPLYPISWMLNDEYDSLSRVSQIDAAILILVAEYDQVIGSVNSDHLITEIRLDSNNRLKVHKLANTDHITISHQPEYYQRVGAFLSTKN